MNQQSKPGPDFSGQNLSGRSFRGQDLRGAVFCNADLRGVDFREADLTGADFSGARMGKTWRRQLLELPMQFMSGIIEGFFILLVIAFMATLMIKPLSKLIDTTELADTAVFYWALLPWLGLQMGIAWTAWRVRREWREWFVHGLMVFLAVAVAVDVAAAVVVAEAMAGGLGLAVAVAGAGAITVLDFWWRSRQALQNEIPGLDEFPRLDRINWPIRFNSRFRCAGSTDFRKADLTGAVLSGVNLAYVRFAGATLNRTQWHNAINLHQANTYGTVLQVKHVRELMTTGNTLHKDFHGKDLHGLDFSSLNLAEANFTDCNLTGASFKRADLTAAKLTRAVLVGADLSNVRCLTGASIGHWNIDQFTLFEGIVCEYVYLDEKCTERHPKTGQFRPGEFAKLYQEIAHTVDFLIENSTQMDALLNTLEQLRTSYDDEDIAQVQKVERKGKDYKVSVAVLAEFEDNLRKEIRKEFAQQLLQIQSQVSLLQHDQKQLPRDRDNLKESLINTLSPPNNQAHSHPSNDSDKPPLPLRIFISYSHDECNYFPTFKKDFVKWCRLPQFKIEVFADDAIPIGMDWDEFLKTKVAECDIMILLVSQAFINSNYIREKEFGAALERLKAGRSLLIVPIYFAPCQFESEEELSRLQFFKPHGERFGQASKGNDFAFIHLVKFRETDGQPLPNSNCEDYMMELMQKLRPKFLKLGKAINAND